MQGAAQFDLLDDGPGPFHVITGSLGARADRLDDLVGGLELLFVLQTLDFVPAQLVLPRHDLTRWGLPIVARPRSTLETDNAGRDGDEEENDDDRSQTAGGLHFLHGTSLDTAAAV